MFARNLNKLFAVIACLAFTPCAKAQLVAVGVPSNGNYSQTLEDFVGSLARSKVVTGDPLIIPQAAIYKASEGQFIRFNVETFHSLPSPQPGIFGLRIRDKEGKIPSNEWGQPLILSSNFALAQWGWGIPLTNLPKDFYQMEFLNQAGSVVRRLKINPTSDCGSCQTRDCLSKSALKSVHFTIPVGLTDPATNLEPQMVQLEFYQEDIPIAGAQSIRLLSPQSSSVVPTYGTSGELQSLRVGLQLATIQQIAGPNPGDPPGLDITVSSDWQNPSTSIVRTVTIRNKEDDNNDPYLEFDELVGSKHTITTFRETSGDWIMETGNGLRRETRSVTETATVKTVRLTVKERTVAATESTPAVYETVSDKKTISNLFSWGWSEVQNILDPDAAAALTTTTTYYENGQDSSLDGSNSSEGYTRVKQITHPTGETESHYYFKNAPGDFFQDTHVVKKAYAGVQNALEITTEVFSGISATTGKAISASRTTESTGGNILAKRENSTEALANGVFSEDRIYNSTSGYTSTFTFRNKNGTVTTVNPDGTASINSKVTDATSGYTTSTGISGYVTSGGTTSTPQVKTVLLTESVTDRYNEEIINQTYRFKNSNQILMSRKLATDFDENHRATRFEHFVEGNDDPVFVTEREYACCGLARERDEHGIDTHYAYDDLKRPVLTNRAGITTATVRTGLSVSQHRYAQTISSGGSLAIPGSASATNEISRSVSNLLGDVIEQWNRSPQDGTFVKTTIQTSFNLGYGIGRRVITLPPVVADDGAVTPSRTDDFHLDGNPASSTGNLVSNRGYRYSSNATGPTVESFLLDGATEKENTIIQSDWARREMSVIYSSDMDGIGGNDRADSFYNVKGQLAKTVDPDGVTLLYDYNLRGERTHTALDINNNGTIDLAADRVSFSETDLAQRQGGEWVMRSTRKDWIDPGATATTTSHQDTSLDGLRNWSIAHPTLQVKESRSTTTLNAPGSLTHVSIFPDNTSQTSAIVNGLVTQVIAKDADGTDLYQIDNGYDALNRLHTQTDTRSGTTTQHYVNTTTDVVNRTVDNQNRETLLSSDHRGRLKTTDLPDTVDEDADAVFNVSVTHHYPDGRVQEQTGDGNYRTTWTYDYAGRPATMTTYGTATAVTRWVYDAGRGFLTGKLYDSPTPGSGTGSNYTYTAGGRVKTITQARLVSGNPLVTTHAYGTAPGSSPADLDQVSHSDGSPGHTITSRDRLGRALEIQDAAGTRVLEYTRHGALKSDTITAGMLSGQKIEQGFDSLLRPHLRAASFGAESLGTTTYGFGPTGAIRTVTGNGQSATYHYHATKRVLERVSYIQAGQSSSWLQSTRQHDATNRLTRITTHVDDGGTQKAIDHHAYAYDALDRINSHSDMTGAAWNYRYNATGEVTKAAKALPGGASDMNGRSYRYHFDGIGNRTLVEQSRDSGQSARGFGYTPDALNQYSAVTHPSFVDVAGYASPSSTVTVNTESVTRQGGYFRKELSEDNSTGPQWIDSQITDGTTTADGSLALPAASVTPLYDEDGNLKSDGLWTYSWDAQNRLIRCERASALVTAGAPYLKIEYDYDSQGRRIRSSHFTSSGTTTPASQTLFIFNGWKCVAELNALSSNQVIRKYTWGLDLAGDAGDSSTGNIGALLWLVDTASNKTHVHLFDRNGNVSGLVDATTRKRSATYDYDSFGQLTTCYGEYAKKNPFTFSTKHTDYATGLCYYGYRWYSPMHGRWISRDLIGEAGGFNLYGFVGNNGVMYYDYLGQRGFLSDFIDGSRSFYGAVGSDLRNHAVAIGSALAGAASQELYYIGEGPFKYLDRNMNRIDSTSRDVEDIFNGLNQYIDDPNYQKSSNDFLRGEADQIAAYLDAASRDPECMEELLRKANVATIEALVLQLATKGIGMGASAANLRLRAALQRIGAKAAKGVDMGMPHLPGYLPDSAPVLRGGQNMAHNFANGSGVSTGNGGLLDGVSVNSSGYGQSLGEIANGIPHSKVGSTTVGQVRAAGGDVIPSPNPRNPWHATMSGVDADTASELMQPLIPNPAKR